MIILYAFAGLLGLYLFSLTFVMKESTEGLWVNRIAELWIRIDDRNKAIGDTTKTLFRVLAENVASLFNRIVGNKMISIRVVGISGSLSFASLFCFFGLFFEIASYVILTHSDTLERLSSSGSKLVHETPVLILGGILFLLVSGFCLALGLLPVLLKSSIWGWLSCLPTALWLLLTFRFLYYHIHSDFGGQLGIVAALAISLASDLLLLILIRSSLGWILVRTTIPRIISAMAMQVFVLSLFIFPFLLPIKVPGMSKSSLGVSIFMLALFNIPTAIASMTFGISLLVVLLHRFSWPLLSRLTYILTRNEVLDKRKTVRAIGGALMLFGLSGVHLLPLLMKVAERLLKLDLI